MDVSKGRYEDRDTTDVKRAIEKTLVIKHWNTKKRQSQTLRDTKYTQTLRDPVRPIDPEIPSVTGPPPTWVDPWSRE